MGRIHLMTVAALALVPVVALAQEPGQTLPSDTAIPGLMFFTLFAALAIAVGSFLYFLRKRSNRAAAERVLLNSDEPPARADRRRDSV